MQGCTAARYYGPDLIVDRYKYPVITIDRKRINENINVLRLKPYYMLRNDVDKLANEFDFHLSKESNYGNTMRLTSPAHTDKPLVKPPMLMRFNVSDQDTDPDVNNLFNENMNVN